MGTNAKLTLVRRESCATIAGSLEDLLETNQFVVWDTRSTRGGRNGKTGWIVNYNAGDT